MDLQYNTLYHKKRYFQIKELYIDKFLYGDSELWEGRRQPFTFFKHIFRQEIHESLIDKVSLHADFEGVDPSSIYHSLQAPVNLHPELENVARTFLKKQLAQDPKVAIKQKFQSHIKQGYTADDVARHYIVHQNVVDKILDNQYVSPQTIDHLIKQI